MSATPNEMGDMDTLGGQRDTHRVLSRLSPYAGTSRVLIVPSVPSLSLCLSLFL